MNRRIGVGCLALALAFLGATGVTTAAAASTVTTSAVAMTDPEPVLTDPPPAPEPSTTLDSDTEGAVTVTGKISTPTFCAYSAINYGGSQYCYGTGNYSCFSAINSNVWSSLKTYNYKQWDYVVGYEGWQLTLYDGTGCSGAVLDKFGVRLCAGCYQDNDFRNGGYCCGLLGNYNDRPSSFRVQKVY